MKYHEMRKACVRDHERTYIWEGAPEAHEPQSGRGRDLKPRVLSHPIGKVLRQGDVVPDVLPQRLRPVHPHHKVQLQRPVHVHMQQLLK